MPIYFGNQKVGPTGVAKVYYGNDLKYEKDEGNGPLCFTCTEGTATLNCSSGVSTNLQISSNGTSWSSWTVGDPITIPVGGKRYIRNNNNTLSTSSSTYFNFLLGGTCKVKVSGNVNSMINYSEVSEYCFYNLFIGCGTRLNDASKLNLPSLTLAGHCYEYMFRSSGIVATPKLPATTLANNCYSSMFFMCANLKTVSSVLPTDGLVFGCYNSMFSNSGLKVGEGSSGNVFFRCPDTIPTASVSSMFLNTLGTFKSNPNAGQSYYYY